MVKVFKGTEQEYYMDGYLKINLDTAITVVKQDWDMVFLVDGREGAGKSNLAQQVAYYLDTTFCLARIVFTPEGFERAVRSANKFQCIVYDEAYGGLSSKSALQSFNKMIVKMLTEIRDKNLFIIIVLPTFFDLVKYVAIWRSVALIHVTADHFKRGTFCFYDYHRKKDLYIYGKKFYSYKKPKPNFFGSFLGHYTVDKDEYKRKKRIETSKSNTFNQRDKFKELYFKVIANMLSCGYQQKQIAEVLEVSASRISQIISENEIKPKKLVLPQ